MKFFSVLNTDTGQWEVTSYDGAITIETESKTAAEWIESLVSDVEQIDTDKISEPEADGTEGQVLMTDGEGGRSWGTINGAEISADSLVIKESTSPTVAILDLGDELLIPETVNGVTTNVAYIVVEKRQNTVVVLRTKASARIEGSCNSGYVNTPQYAYLTGNTGFITRFSNAVKSSLVEDSVITIPYHNGALTSYNLKIFSPSYYEMDTSATIAEGQSGSAGAWLIPIKKYKGNTSMTDAQARAWQTEGCANALYRGSAGTGMGSTYMWAQKMSDGSNNLYSFSSTGFGVVPAMFISVNAKIEASGTSHILIGISKNYVGTVEDIQDGNNYYKFSDQDARASITAIKDGTSIDSFGDVESALGDKITLPATVGTEGQVLMLDSDLIPIWGTLNTMPGSFNTTSFPTEVNENE